MLTEKQIKKERKDLLILHTRLYSDWQFGNFRTWTGLYQQLGISQVDDKPITYPELKGYLQKQTDELEERLKKEVEVECRLDSEQGVSNDSRQESIQNGQCRPASKEPETIAQPSTSMRLEGNVGTSTTSPQLDLSPKATPRVPDITVVSLSPNDNDLATDKATSDSDYGLVKNKNWKVFHYWFQKKAIKEALDNILGFDTSLAEGSMEKLKELYEDQTVIKKPATGILILSATGTGKTFIVAALARILWDIGYHDNRTFSHIPYLWVTKTTVVEQAGRVLKRFYGLEPVNDIEVVNIETLRSKVGALWLTKTQKTTVIRGEPFIEDVWTWKKGLQPCIMFFDESQGAKNADSTQSQIIQAYNDLPSNALLVCVSATPFARISDAKYFAVATKRRLDHLSGFPVGSRLTNQSWPLYAAKIAGAAKPSDYNKASVDRLMDDLEPWIIRVTNVRPQYKAINSVRVIPFETPEKERFYLEAWERFLREKAKLEELQQAGDQTSEVCMFTILLKFAMAAEMCHADHFTRDMVEDVKKGFAAVAAVKQKGTIIEIVKQLITVYSVPRNKISLIWGGGQTQLTKKQKDRQKVKEMEEKLKAAGFTAEEILGDLGLEDVEDRKILNLPPEWRLGPQTMEERQEEIDRFQKGESLYCLYTFKSGGVGLSLHHSDELTKEKCRRKESGYAVEEDIPLIPVRPRKTHIMLTYNAMELVQGVGRCPRLTSLSDTIQQVYAYAGTIEVDIGNIVSQKLRCLTAVVKQKESWQQIIMNGSNESARAQKVKEIIDQTKDVADDQDGQMIGDVEGEEE